MTFKVEGMTGEDLAACWSAADQAWIEVRPEGDRDHSWQVAMGVEDDLLWVDRVPSAELHRACEYMAAVIETLNNGEIPTTERNEA